MIASPGRRHPASPVVWLAPFGHILLHIWAKCIKWGYHNFQTGSPTVYQYYFNHLTSLGGGRWRGWCYFSIGPKFYILSSFFDSVWATWPPHFSFCIEHCLPPKYITPPPPPKKKLLAPLAQQLLPSPDPSQFLNQNTKSSRKPCHASPSSLFITSV